MHFFESQFSKVLTLSPSWGVASSIQTELSLFASSSILNYACSPLTLTHTAGITRSFTPCGHIHVILRVFKARGCWIHLCGGS